MADEIADLREHAQRCRRLARVAEDAETRAKLNEIARQFDVAAAQIEAREGPPAFTE